MKWFCISGETCVGLCVDKHVNPLKTVLFKVPVRTALHLGYKNRSVYVILAKIAVCSEINIKHNISVWRNVKLLKLNLLVLHLISMLLNMLYCYIMVHISKYGKKGLTWLFSGGSVSRQ
jgi:hypothetical protein